MRNKLLNSSVVVVLILAILIAARNIIVQVGLEQYVRVATGLRLNIGKIDTGLLEPTMTISDLRLYNPSGYADPVMAEIGEIHLRYKCDYLLKGRIYLKELYFSLEKLFIIRKSENQLNFNLFQTHGHKQPLPLTIDDFTLKISQIVYKNYIHGSMPVQKTYNLNFNEQYRGIQGTNDMEHRIIESVLNKTSIAAVIQGDLNRFREDISGTILNGIQVSDNSINGLLNVVFLRF